MPPLFLCALFDLAARDRGGAAITDATPAIYRYPETDEICTVVCGYIGGRHVLTQERCPAAGSAQLYALCLASGWLCAFCGGNYYALIMQKHRQTGFKFAFQNRFLSALALAGVVLSLRLYGRPGEAEWFRLVDCVNGGVLVAWGVSKAWTDLGDELPTAEKFLLSYLLGYTYCVGGGTTRDLVSHWLDWGVAFPPANLTAPVVVPLSLGLAVYFGLQKALGGAATVVPLLGIPAVALCFAAVAKYG